MFYNAIPIGMILKHASHTLLELLQYRCKTKTRSCNPDHPPHLSSLRPLSFPRLMTYLRAFCCFEDIRSKIYSKENSLRVYWAPNMQIARSRGMIFMALKSILK